MALLPYSLEIEALDLGADVKAVGLELIKTGSREPLRGPEAAQIWSAALPAIAGKEPWVLDFFSHVERVCDFCRRTASRFAAPPSAAASCRRRNRNNWRSFSNGLKEKLSEFARAARSKPAMQT